MDLADVVFTLIFTILMIANVGECFNEYGDIEEYD